MVPGAGLEPALPLPGKGFSVLDRPLRPTTCPRKLLISFGSDCAELPPSRLGLGILPGARIRNLKAAICKARCYRAAMPVISRMSLAGYECR